ncbi:MAG: hypothetical protein ABI042_15415 [Verrucomicrobiota bacterium]
MPTFFARREVKNIWDEVELVPTTRTLLDDVTNYSEGTSDNNPAFERRVSRDKMSSP